MKRNVSLQEISDGRLYGPNDMVKADSRGCKGCFECCRGMGNSVVLDPYDIYRLTLGLKRSFEELLQQELALNVVDGVILPNLKMTGPEERCVFLDERGRCRIHSARPGICRLFPLGRYYENKSFRYFLQTGECPVSRVKVRVSKWIDTPELGKNQEFLITWHYFHNELEERIRENEDDNFRRNLNMLLLKIFYLAPYEEGDFYEQFIGRHQLFCRASAE